MKKMQSQYLAQEKILFFQPYLKDVIWAGDKLQEVFQTKHKIGEAWLLSAIVDKQSLCLNKAYDNQGLKEIFDNHKQLFGTKFVVYPNLSKIIDTKLPLSVQVHPNNQMAKAYNSFGKEECWYVLENDGSKFVLGDHSNSKEEAISLIKTQQFEQLLQYHNVKQGDFLYVPAGIIHAIPQNTTVFELQQSSDITFRLYDYDRLEKNGQPRQLHTLESCQALSGQKNYFIKEQPKDNLVTNEFFNFQKIKNVGQQTYNFINKNWIEIFVIEGSGSIDQIPIKKYAAFILTKGNGSFVLEGNLTILLNIV